MLINERDDEAIPRWQCARTQRVLDSTAGGKSLSKPTNLQNTEMTDGNISASFMPITFLTNIIYIGCQTKLAFFK